jgi:hypothetical protein
MIQIRKECVEKASIDSPEKRKVTMQLIVLMNMNA